MTLSVEDFSIFFIAANGFTPFAWQQRGPRAFVSVVRQGGAADCRHAKRVIMDACHAKNRNISQFYSCATAACDLGRAVTRYDYRETLIRR